MNRLRAVPVISPLLRVVAVLALLALISTRLFVHSGGATELTNAELAHLPVQIDPHQRQPAPAKQSAASSCFSASPAVSSVRSDGHQLVLHFAGRRQEMEIEFLATEDAAIRATNANPNELGNFYNNTIWLRTPKDLSRADFAALGRCIPSGPRHG